MILAFEILTVMGFDISWLGAPYEVTKTHSQVILIGVLAMVISPKFQIRVQDYSVF